jgi:hypothetical protein
MTILPLFKVGKFP